MTKKTVVAICYDFDKTLAVNDMQSFAFIPNLGLTEEEFWNKCELFSKTHGTDSTLSYLKVMIDEAKSRGIKLTKEYLNQCGKAMKFFEGVTTWFKRMNEFASEHNIALEHYSISSGNKEILEGSSIYDEFKQVYGCEFLYDEEGVAYWPKTIVNYTLKTQYLFRICKGTIDLTNDEQVNQRIEKKHVEFRNIIYIGDGVTDIPCMTLVKEKGGTAISVYPKGKKEKSLQLLQDNRVNYAVKSDFKTNSELENLMKIIFESIELQEKLRDMQE